MWIYLVTQADPYLEVVYFRLSKMSLLQDELELRGLIFKNNSLVWKDALEKDPEITHKKKIY